ncbi:MAG: CapA family protein, partial [Cyclobacteriaceae bacterium]
METRVTLFITCFSIFFVCKSQDTTRVSLLFVGDVMQHDSQIRAAFDPESNSYDYTDCFGHIAPVVQSADLAFANLEVTLAGPPFKGYPQFSAPDPLAVGLKESGFDV